MSCTAGSGAPGHSHGREARSYGPGPPSTQPSDLDSRPYLQGSELDRVGSPGRGGKGGSERAAGRQASVGVMVDPGKDEPVLR